MTDYGITTTSVQVTSSQVPAFAITTDTTGSTKLTADRIAELFSRAADCVLTDESSAHTHGTIASNGIISAITTSSILRATYYLVLATTDSSTGQRPMLGPKLTISGTQPASPAAGDIWIKY